jgi:mycothiol synthase
MIIRPYRAADLEGVYTVITAAGRKQGTRRYPRTFLQTLTNPENTTAVVILERQIVGFALWEKTRFNTLQLEGWVHPDFYRREVGTALLIAGERAALDHACRAIVTTCYDDAPGSAELFSLRGFNVIRRFDQRWLTLADHPETHETLPDGLVTRPYHLDQLTALVDAQNDAFSTHWGNRRFTVQGIQSRIDELPDFDPARFLCAWDGDQIVSMVLAHGSLFYGEPHDAWVWLVGTRQAYQGRGLARILLNRVLTICKAHGYQRVGLHVDSENPPAVTLYEKLGLKKTRQRVHFEKVLGEVTT